MRTDRQTELFAEIVRRILVISDPEQIILFGSHARAESGPDSDVDLLVIEAGIAAPRQESVRIRRALRGLLVPIDVIVATPRQIDQHRNDLGLIYSTALREGKVLYERTAHPLSRLKPGCNALTQT
ncbi:MAG TPA: nucleotidyltransferase domain-containing protein [Anaerolineae bacterium]|nr:nucleotidyltransferase domain-containing protein [Anaerolineae bacterium]HMR67494.1 nucleotidyltransferase domain-containing protein [Anaerolineae bacterium]